MFGKKQNTPADDNTARTPEGQADYPSIDDAADQSQEAGDAQEMLARLRAELDEVNDRWKRALADFQNYQRRALQNEQEARRQGITAVVMSVVPVLDHLDLALNQKNADASAERILAGVRVIRDQLLQALERHGVRVINPAPNEVFDPHRHEAIAQQAAEGVDPGHIAATYQPGFELEDRPIRCAKVAVAPAQE